jgi:hypothetical protein
MLWEQPASQSVHALSKRLLTLIDARQGIVRASQFSADFGRAQVIIRLQGITTGRW